MALLHVSILPSPDRKGPVRRLATLLLPAFIVSVCGAAAAPGGAVQMDLTLLSDSLPRVVPYAGGGSQGRFQQGIQLSDSQRTLHSRASARFDLGDLHELWVRVRVAQMPAVSMLNIKLFSPRGFLHYETNSAFSTDPAMRSIEVAGAPHAISVHPARAVPGGFELDLSIAVAGTVLTRYPKTGTWQVTATLEGVPGTFSLPMEIFISAN